MRAMLQKRADTASPASARTGRALRPPSPSAAPPRPHDVSRVPIDGVAQRKPDTPGPGGLVRAPNRTGLPDGLKAGLESLSGLSMDRVRVHYGSQEPARLQAHAFTRGTDIHLAPGQEHHLAHEAWHVVQQAEGRVRPTLDVAGAHVNDDAGLEQEADRLGAASAAHGAALARHPAVPADRSAELPAARPEAGCAQRVIEIEKGALKGEYVNKSGKDTKRLVEAVQKEIGDDLQRGWKGKVEARAADAKKRKYKYSETFLKYLKKKYPKKEKQGKIRPGFPKPSEKVGKIGYALQTGRKAEDIKPADENLAMPHRFPYAAIQSSTLEFIEGREDEADLERWSDRLLRATEERRDITLPKLKGTEKAYYKKTIEEQILEFSQARIELEKSVANGDSLTLTSPVVQRFLKITNGLHGNIPDYGPHEGVNIQVSDRLHLHFHDDGTLTPGSRAAGSMTPKRVPKGIAYTKDKGYLVTTDGKKVAVSDLKKLIAQQLSKHAVGATTIAEEDLEEADFA
jgi:hypothetical protein